MLDSTNPSGTVTICDDRLLTLDDVAAILGTCDATARTVLRETGKAIVIHRRQYILESNLLTYLHSLEGDDE